MGCADSKDKATAPTLKAGEQLNKGQSIVSANGRFKFILQEDGNAVVYRGERALWGSNTHGKTVTHLTLAADGVLFIKNAEENVWSTETAGSAADQLTIKDDGNLVLLDKDGNTKWESKSTFDDGQFDLRTKSAVVAAKAPIGVTVEAGKTYYWCTCGKSKNQPFCDGSHADTEFKPLAWTAPESKEVYFCVCKKTDNAPFCDGAHSKIEDAPPAAAAAAPSPADESQYDLRTKSAVVADRKPIGVAVEAGKTYYWCTCGKSKNQPWCDGSHQGTEFKPLAWTAPESKEVYLCLCKQTKNAPFCDGAHASLPDESQYDLRTKSATVALRRPLKIAVEAGKTYYWCTCGKSKNQPWCDGSHQGTEFKPLAWTAPESKDVFICACKQTKNAPFCDGAHRALPPTDTLNRSTTDYLIPGGAGITSKNGKFRVVLQTDGNVVLYEGPENLSEHAKWATGTDGKEGAKFIVQADGNVVLYNKADQPLWASNTDGSAATRLVVTDDGKLVLFGEGDQHLWSS